MVKEMINLKNETWLDENEEEVTFDEFKNNLNVIEIAVHQDGQFNIYYSINNLFFGHDISAYFDSYGKFQSADLVG